MIHRWDDYVRAQDGSPTAVEELWIDGAGRGRVLYILGQGFDPRALVGIRRLIDCGCATQLHIVSIGLRAITADELTVTLAQTNLDGIAQIVGHDSVTHTHVPIPEVEEPSSAGLKLAHDLINRGVLDERDLVIVDVSALPTSIHFPVIGAILRQRDTGALTAEFQVVVCHNAELDDRIIEAGLGPAGPIGGFSSSSIQRDERETRVWAPVVGKGQGAALQMLYDYIEPDEICPILPFPAARPRRADDLLLEHHQLLIERIQVEPRNLIHASETNPFDLYRTLCRLQAQYREALQVLRPVKLIVSSHASKLLSLGVLLAAYEHSLSVVTAGATDYSIDPSVDLIELSKQNLLACLWLDGSPYAASPGES